MGSGTTGLFSRAGTWPAWCMSIRGAATGLVCASPLDGPSPWLRRSWQTVEGLPDKSVTGLVQTGGVCLWLGSDRGWSICSERVNVPVFGAEGGLTVQAYRSIAEDAEDMAAYGYPRRGPDQGRGMQGFQSQGRLDSTLGLNGDLVNLSDGVGSAGGDIATLSISGLYGNVSHGRDSGNETWSFSQVTGDLSLTVVPEPRAAPLAGLGLLVLLRQRRN
jgi:hypothetical protein